QEGSGYEVGAAPCRRELTRAQPGERARVEGAAEAAEALLAGRLPQLADLIVGERAPAIAGGFEPLGAGVHRPAQAGERVGSEEPAADAPFQEHARELAQIIGGAGAAAGAGRCG